MSIFSEPMNKKNIKMTIAALLTGLIMIIFPLVIGLADDPPGIVSIILGTLTLFLAFVHHKWEAKIFIVIYLASGAGFIVFGILHNLFHGLAELLEDVNILVQVIQFLSAVFFLIAVLACPAGVLVGLVGIIITFFKRKKDKD